MYVVRDKRIKIIKKIKDRDAQEEWTRRMNKLNCTKRKLAMPNGQFAC